MSSRARITMAILSVLAGVGCTGSERQTLTAPNRTANADIGSPAESQSVIPGGDYGGGDLSPVDGATLSGTFTNVGRFTIAAGTHVHVASGVPLSVSANSVDIEGVLDADGAGYPGGPTQTGDLRPGNPGAGPGGGQGSGIAGCYDAPGGAGGGYGGAGGWGGQVHDTPVEAQGGKPYGGGVNFRFPDQGSGGGSAGAPCGGAPADGGGGAGGGAISIVSTGDIVVSGSVLADGFPGVHGTSSGGLCCALGTFAFYNTSGGGGGSGGGVYLSGKLTFAPAAIISASGGVGGAIVPSMLGLSGQGFAIPGGGGGGGRVRLDGCTYTAPTVVVGGGAAGVDGSRGHLALISMSKPGAPGTVEDRTTACPPRDATPPVILQTVTGTLGATGWYTSAVAVHWNVSDAESSVTATSGCDDLSLTANQTEQTYTCSATSGGGNAQQAVTIKIDQTIPTVNGSISSGTLGANGWYTSDVVVSWTPSAPGPSGQTTFADCANVSQTTDTHDATFTCTVSTGAGVSRQGTLHVKRDATPPSVSFAGNAGSYTVDQTVMITCAASDGMSGIAQSTCAPIAGDGYTFALGANSYRASATDVAGNVGSASTSFSMSVTNDAVCRLVQRWAKNAGIANALCTKLVKGNYDPFRSELAAQTGSGVSETNAAILAQLVNALDAP